MCVSLLFSVSQRRDAVVQRRQRVKSLEQQRTSELQASLAWQQFSRDADEVLCELLCMLNLIFVAIVYIADTCTVIHR